MIGYPFSHWSAEQAYRKDLEQRSAEARYQHRFGPLIEAQRRGVAWLETVFIPARGQYLPITGYLKTSIPEVRRS